MWGTDHLGDLVWAILRLCALITSFGTAARSDLFPPLTSRDESCPITLARFGEGAVAAYRSLHPCAVFKHGTKYPRNPARWPYSSSCQSIPRLFHAGMHWVREEGFQGLWALSVETGEQFTCPLCRQPVAFARTYEIGG